MHHLKVLDFRGDKIPATRYMAAAHYEGAGTGRRMSYWGLSSEGPNNSLYSSLNSLRSRSRELVRNDPQIDGGMDNTLIADIVGTGITPRWQLEDTGLKKYGSPLLKCCTLLSRSGSASSGAVPLSTWFRSILQWNSPIRTRSYRW